MSCFVETYIALLKFNDFLNYTYYVAQFFTPAMFHSTYMILCGSFRIGERLTGIRHKVVQGITEFMCRDDTVEDIC